MADSKEGALVKLGHFSEDTMISSGTVGGATGLVRVTDFIMGLVDDGLIEAGSVDEDSLRYLGSMLDEEDFDKDEAFDTFTGFVPELEEHSSLLHDLLNSRCQPQGGSGGLKRLEEAVVIAEEPVTAKETTDVKKAQKKPVRMSKKDKQRAKRAAKVKQRTCSKSSGSDSSGESGDDAEIPELPEIVGRKDLEGDAALVAQKEQLRAIYRERMSRCQRMAVSRHHRSGRRNDLMEKHEQIAAAMEDKEEEIVYTTPSRFKRHFAGDSKYINVTDMTLSCGDLELLSSADLKLAPGHRYGLVGNNGCGKSTLLKRIASGNVQNFPAYMTTMYIEQEIVGEEAVLLQMPPKAKLDFDSDKRSWKTVEDRLLELYEEMEVLQMDHAEAKACTALDQFGFTQEMMEQPTRLLSGGWRMKVALAQALFMEPDVLLLDEPTNHLDLHGVLWLERHIASGAHNASSVVVVSHDEAFLNNVTNETIIFAGKTLTYYEGNYSQFMRIASEKAQKQRHLYEVQERQRKHILDSIQKAKKTAKTKKLGDKGNTAGIISSRTKALDRLGQQKTEDGKHWKWSLMGMRQQVQAVAAPKELKFKFPPVERLRYDGPLLQLDNVAFSYEGKGGKSILSEVSLDVTAGAKIAVVGKNGAGKSTLMGLVRGTLQPTSGEVSRYHALQVAYYTQHHVEQLDLTISPVEHIKRAFPDEDLSETEVRSQLGKYGISGRTALQTMETLSGGQRSRVVFATVTWGKPQVLLLDEPTNHLDFESIRALSEALQEYGGAVVLISHNQALVQAVAPSNILVVSRGKVRKFPGSFEEYRARVQKAVKY